MRLISLFMNGDLGLELIEVIQKSSIDSQVNLIVINGEQKYSHTFHCKVLSHPVVLNQKIPVMVYTDKLLKSDSFLDLVSKSSLGVSALFGHIFPRSFIDNINFKLINLHPSFLPIGRGSDPIAWGIIENSQQGASIHEITEKLDCGKIISQEKIDSDLSLSAGEVYLLAMQSLKRQFITLLNNGDFEGTVIRDNVPTTFHQAKELEELRKHLSNDGGEAEKILRIIQALTFNDGRSAIVKSADGNLWEISVVIKRIKGTEQTW
jgi:methionyl-tRNA formyltransferase